MSVSCSRYLTLLTACPFGKRILRFHSYKPVLLKWLDAHSGKKH